MLIILSPAKTMDMSYSGTTPKGTEPEYNNEAEYLASKMRQYSIMELARLLKISDKLAEINYERYQQFESPSTPRKQALIAYNGSVFKTLGAGSFSADDFHYAQNRIRIISTLYGLVRPLDLIKAYRIAFNLKLENQAEDLYSYWLPKLTQPLIRAVKDTGKILINLASLDVLGAIQMDLLEKETTVITPEFKEFRNEKYETVRTYAKIARGDMCRHIIQNKIEHPEELKKFSWNDFTFDEDISDERNYIFIRKDKKTINYSTKKRRL